MGRRFRRKRRIIIKDHKDFIEKCKVKHGSNYKFTKTKFKDYNTSVIAECLLHGKFTIKPKKMLGRRGGCRSCRKMSSGEVKIANFLKNQKIKYETEYMLLGYRFRYDFYLPELKILIEFDGIQHFKPVRRFGGLRELKKIQERDQVKDQLAKDAKLHLIRIHYERFDELEEYLSWCLSKIYRYKVKKRFYKTFVELCKGRKLSPETTASDVREYLTKNIHST